MPRIWYDRHEVNRLTNEAEKDFQRSIVADRKPYFMRYIYPPLMKQYNTYIRNANKNALREFDMTIEEMENMKYEELSDRQAEFLRFYRMKMPVGIGDCVMNRICRRIEKKFDGYVSKKSDAGTFDYTIMKSGAQYTENKFYSIKRLYNDYCKQLESYKAFTKYERVEKAEADAEIAQMKEEFRRECFEICQNEDMLCDIVLDICYKRSSTKKFAWDICGDIIVRNLLKRNGGVLSYPASDDDGDFTYCGNSYSVRTVKIEEE